MVGPEGRRFRWKINTLAAGSPTRFLRILSYGLATKRPGGGLVYAPPGVSATSPHTLAQGHERDFFGAEGGSSA